MAEKNSWHYPRTKLAQHYLDLLKDGAGTPLCLYNYRQVGKTHFILNDLIPLAQKKGYITIYIDLWQEQSSPLNTILYAFENTLDDLRLPKTKLGDRLATPVKRVSIMGAGLAFGDSPTRKKPESPYLRIDFLVKEIIREAEKPILLLIDEIQQLAAVEGGEELVASLRSTLTKYRGQLYAIFTGSSQERLRQLFTKAKAPLYHFASQIVFPLLDEEFVTFIANKYYSVTRKKLDQKKLLEAFVALSYRPGVFVDFAFNMMKDASTEIDRYLKAYLAEREDPQKWLKLWVQLRPLEQLILQRISLRKELSSKEALTEYANRIAVDKVSPGSVAHALKKLKTEQIIIPTGDRGSFKFEADAFGDWIKQNSQAS